MAVIRITLPEIPLKLLLERHARLSNAIKRIHPKSFESSFSKEGAFVKLKTERIGKSKGIKTRFEKSLKRMKCYRNVSVQNTAIGIRRNQWRRDDTVVFFESSKKRGGEKKPTLFKFVRDPDDRIECEYSHECNLCRTKIVLNDKVRIGVKRWARFHYGIQSYYDKAEDELKIPTQLGYMITKKTHGIFAHQLCLDYAMGKEMVQDFANLSFEDHLDGYSVEAIKNLLEKKSMRCAICQKPGACTTCADQKCKSKDRSWYHLPCGQRAGSKELPGEKKSFCFLHSKSPSNECQDKKVSRRSCKRTRLDISSSSTSEPANKRKKILTPSQEISLYEDLADHYEIEEEADVVQEQELSMEFKTNPVSGEQAVSREVWTGTVTVLDPIDLDEVMSKLENDASTFSGSQRSNNNGSTDTSFCGTGPIDIKSECLVQGPYQSPVPEIELNGYLSNESPEKNGLPNKKSDSKTEAAKKEIRVLTTKLDESHQEVKRWKENCQRTEEKNKALEKMVKALREKSERKSVKLKQIQQVLNSSSEDEAV